MAGKEAERRKSEEALAGLYEEYYDKIARYIFIHIGDQPEAEDLASEVFLKALRSLNLASNHTRHDRRAKISGSHTCLLQHEALM